MGVKRVFFAAAAAACLVLLSNVASGAVNTREIDKVRNKAVLGSEDLEIIDKFVAEAVGELVRTRDFTSVAKIRTAILARDSSTKHSAAPQYAEQFSESVSRHVPLVFEQALQLSPPEIRFKAVLNILILVDGLANPRLADLPIRMLNEDDTVIRYWAVHSVTNSAFVKKLVSPDAAHLGLAERIVEKLRPLIRKCGPEIIALIAKFSAEQGLAQGQDLLLQIADMRMSRYADWTVEYELLDAAILKLLCERLSAKEANNPAISRRFAQLYSYAIQRYVKGKVGEFLDDSRKRQLASVLVEIENECIGKLLGMRQVVMKKAVEQNNDMALLQEHSRLLGDKTRAGQLPLKLRFDYGLSSEGTRRTWPLGLPDAPERLIVAEPNSG